MKTLISAMLLGLFASNAFAVRVSNCPQSLKLGYSDIQLKSIEQIYETYAYNLGMDTKNIDEDDKAILQEVAKQLTGVQGVTREWPLTEAVQGTCVYRSSGMEKAEIFTKNGKDTLLVQTALEPIKNGHLTKRVVARVYAKIKSMTVDDLLVVARPDLAVGIPRGAYENYDAGGPLVFVGKVVDFTAVASQ